MSKNVSGLTVSGMRDHVHLVASVPLKVSISELMEFMRGKAAIDVFKKYKNLRRKPYWGNHFRSCGHCVTTIRLDEEKIRRYVRYQEDKERLEERERRARPLLEVGVQSHRPWSRSLPSGGLAMLQR
jgi:putative transposase